MPKMILVWGWLITASLCLFTTITTLHFLREPRNVGLMVNAKSNQSQQPILAYQSIVNSVWGNHQKVEVGDARPILIANFLKKHDSPLKPYDHFGQTFTLIADTYGLDYRLLPAIAMQESNLCKTIPSGSFNCLGLGVHSQGTWAFSSFEENFDQAAKILKKNYIDEGLITPEQIQTKYTPSSNGSWQYAINHFMNQIETGNF
jgi:hypothetical protein